MAERNSTHEAIILRLRSTPGDTRVCVFLSPDEGIVEAFVFGGPKSRLAMLAAPYNRGRAWIYRDPVRASVKLTDFDAQAFYPSLRDDLGKSLSAAFFAECALVTHAAGDSRRCYALLSETFDALDRIQATGVRALVVQFAWRLFEIMGVRPDPARCGSCGKALGSKAAFARIDEGFICPECAGLDGSGLVAEGFRPPDGQGSYRPRREHRLVMSQGALRYLRATQELTLQEALRVTTAKEASDELKAFCLASARMACEAKLNTVPPLEALD